MSVIPKIVLVVGGIVLLFSVGFAAGYTFCNRGKQTAVLNQLQDDKKAVEKVRETARSRAEKIIVYVDKIKKVYDPSGCADAPVDPGIDSSLLEAYRSTARPKAD